MVTEEQLDDAARVVAGRLLLVGHLEDVKLAIGSYASRWRDHQVLASHGYDMRRCKCLGADAVVQVRLWAAEARQNRT